MYKLIIADDELGIRNGLACLKWDTFDIEVAATVENGLAAIEYLKNNPVDIVITDIKMPVMDGLELVRRLNESHKDIVVVALSGYDDFDYVKHCLKNRVFDYLLKPLDIDEWQATFQKAADYLDALSQKNEPDETIKWHSKNHIIQAAFGYMQQHYREQLTLTAVADQIYVNPTYLSRIMKKETGMCFTEMLTRLRIEAAKKMLKDPAYKINEIARQVGYVNPRHFTYTFKKYTGCTPYSFRSE